MKLTTDVMKFAIDNMDLFTKFQEYWNHWEYKNNNGKIVYTGELSLDEQENEINEDLVEFALKRAHAEYAIGRPVDEWFFDPQIQFHMFAIVGALVDMILPQTIVGSIGAYTDVRVGGFGDSFNFDVKSNDIFYVTKAGDGKRNSEVHREFSSQVSILPVAHQLTAGVSLYRVLCGRASLAELAMKIVRSFETEISKETYGVFETAMDAADATATTGLLVSGYTQESLVRLCQQVQEWNNGAKPIIMGTQLALTNVLPDDANYRYDLTSKYATLGYVETAFGFDTMVIRQVADRTTQFAANVINNDRLWIISPSAPKLLKLCLAGRTLSVTDGVMDNADLTQNTTMTKRWGSGFCSNSVAGVVQLT